MTGQGAAARKSGVSPPTEGRILSRSIDHLVLATHDLDGLAAGFAALGFSVGGRNRHPWGTENRLIQLADRTFLELITIGEGAKIAPRTPRDFSFGAFVADALSHGRTGLIMLALTGDDARADAAEFARAGLGEFAPFDFGRKGRKPDGSEVELAFSLAFAASKAMPDCGFFTCQHHYPENFWSDAAQLHAIGALGISRVTLIAENPADHHIFLSALSGAREIRATSTGIELQLGGARLEMLTAEGHAMRYGNSRAAKVEPRFAGFGIRVRNLRKAVEIAAAAGIEHRPHGSSCRIGFGDSFDADILLEEERAP